MPEPTSAAGPVPAPERTSADPPADPTADAPAHWSDAEHLRVFVAEREVTCPLCRYNLRGLTSDRCPECGQRLKLGVALAEPYIAAWVTLVVNLCLVAGGGLLMALITLQEGMPHGLWMEPMDWFAYWYAMATVPLAGAALASRRVFCRQPTTTQWLIAGVPTIINIVLILWILNHMNY